ncbi:DUF2480 family protein [Chitinophaga sedimenti]|nr:DUF2480 family protein [Chitinophaga sedimenti]MCK7554121.1 DUF2480 family protein [Chitinophaga sedimenti]
MELINKVDASGILSVDLKDYRPQQTIVFFDISPHLHMGLMLKEKEFRASLENTDWEQFRDKAVAVGCSTDAIIPTWAYMMLADKLQGIAACTDYTTPENLALQLWKNNIRNATRFLAAAGPEGGGEGGRDRAVAVYNDNGQTETAGKNPHVRGSRSA